MIQQRIRQGLFFSAIILSIIVMISIIGCGGGTTGTGSSEFSGRILDESGAPISNATVTMACLRITLACKHSA